MTTLWHIPVSHYAEKVRWALEYKDVTYKRRAVQPPAHMAVALALTRGRHKTVPVLQLDGRTIGDSTAIIAALEEEYPDAPLYPADAADRRRALELEDWFDEEVGPHSRLLAWHEVSRDRPALEEITRQQLPAVLTRYTGGLVSSGVSTFVNLRYGVHDEDAAEVARVKLLAAFDRIEEELDGDYLVGGRFSVADLTAAALLYPVVLPPEGPQLGVDPPEAFQRFRAPLEERRGFRWVEEMFRRHRWSAAE